jgi:hypothetical protein
LFEKSISPLQYQKNNRELEQIVQECIFTAIRESIPTEAIIMAYMDESTEQEEEVIIENIEEPINGTAAAGDSIQDDMDQNAKSENISKEEDIPSVVPSVKNIDNEDVITRLSFNDIDSILDDTNVVKTIEAPKTIERLEEISTSRAIQRKLDEESDSDNDDDRIKIHGDQIDLSGFDILDQPSSSNSLSDFTLNDVEELI